MKKTDGIDRAVELMVCSKPRTEHIKRVLGLIDKTWIKAPDLRLTLTSCSLVRSFPKEPTVGASGFLRTNPHGEALAIR